MRRRIFMRLTHIWAKRTHIPDVNVQSLADAMKHVQADAVVFNEFLVGGFTDPGKGYDVALCIAASLEEDPKLPVAYHGIGLLCVSG